MGLFFWFSFEVKNKTIYSFLGSLGKIITHSMPTKISSPKFVKIYFIFSCRGLLLCQGFTHIPNPESTIMLICSSYFFITFRITLRFYSHCLYSYLPRIGILMMRSLLVITQLLRLCLLEKLGCSK